MDGDSIVVSGKTYVSAKRASALTGYAADYIGQLARGGQIEAKQLGRTWYVNQSAISRHRIRAQDGRTLERLKKPHEIDNAPTIVRDRAREERQELLLRELMARTSVPGENIEAFPIQDDGPLLPVAEKKTPTHSKPEEATAKHHVAINPKVEPHAHIETTIAHSTPSVVPVQKTLITRIVPRTKHASEAVHTKKKDISTGISGNIAHLQKNIAKHAHIRNIAPTYTTKNTTPKKEKDTHMLLWGWWVKASVGFALAALVLSSLFLEGVQSFERTDAGVHKNNGITISDMPLSTTDQTAAADSNNF